MKSVEIITFTLKIPANIALLAGLGGAAQKLLTRYYTMSYLNSAECLLSTNAPSRCVPVMNNLWPSVGKELSPWLFTCAFCLCVFFSVFFYHYYFSTTLIVRFPFLFGV